MKSMISIFWLFAFPFVINGANVPELYPEEVERLDILAKNKTTINEALVLEENGYLGEGGYGIVYEGVILADRRSVAIKFFPKNKILHVRQEIAMYSYLEAYKNENVEKYGIPAVYYYDRWENYILIAMTKFDEDLREITNGVSDFGQNPLDVLILFRDFVYQSKYIHSRGVRHDDIKPDNIMVRGHRTFLIDFNLSSKILEDKRGGTMDYICKRFACKETRRAIDDWESYLYTMSIVLRNDWFRPEYDNKNRLNTLVIEDERLDRVIKAFAMEVFTDDVSKVFPDYDHLEALISHEIAEMHPNGEPQLSWVEAAPEVSPIRNIKDIFDPKSIDFKQFVYPVVVRLPPLDNNNQQSILVANTSESSKNIRKRFCCFVNRPSE